MGRPRRHDERTAAALLDAAERIVDAEGLEALSIRRVAAAVATSTRAVYSVFGSKDGLIAALGARGFDLLRTTLEALPVSDDPGADLVEAGVQVFRRFVVEHPSLYAIGIQRTSVSPETAAAFRDSAARAMAVLTERVVRLETAGSLGGRPVIEARLAFHALCEGLAEVELRGFLPRGEEERIWRDALGALIAGFGAD